MYRANGRDLRAACRADVRFRFFGLSQTWPRSVAAHPPSGILDDTAAGSPQRHVREIGEVLLSLALSETRSSRFRRPNDVHVAVRLGAGRSRLPPQDLTHAWICSCGTPCPRSSESIAFLTPATCHSFTSRYSLSASAARNDRLRPVLFASFSSRFLTSLSTRTVNVVEEMIIAHVMDCVHTTTKLVRCN